MKRLAFWSLLAAALFVVKSARAAIPCEPESANVLASVCWTQLEIENVQAWQPMWRETGTTEWRSGPFLVSRTWIRLDENGNPRQYRGVYGAFDPDPPPAPPRLVYTTVPLWRYFDVCDNPTTCPQPGRLIDVAVRAVNETGASPVPETPSIVSQDCGAYGVPVYVSGVCVPCLWKLPGPAPGCWS